MRPQLFVFLCIFFLILPNQSLFGQLEKGFRADIGMSAIFEDYGSGFPSVDEKIALSGQLGFFLNIPVNEKLYIGSGLNFNFIQGQSERNRDFFSDAPGGGIIGFERANFSRHILYLSLPLSLGINLERAQLEFGLQTSLNLTSGGEEEVASELQGRDLSRTEDIESSEFQNFDFGPRIGANFELTEKIALACSYYFGAYNIKSEERNRFSWRTNQLLLGVLFHLNN